MSQSIRLVDAAGNPAAHTTTIWTARAVDVGRFFGALGIAVGRQNAADGQAFLAAQCPGLTLAIMPAAGPSDPNATTLYFAVDSLQATLGVALSNYGRLVSQPYHTPLGYQAVVADPDGRRIILTELAGGPRASGFGAPTFVEPPRPSLPGNYGGGYITRAAETREESALAAVKRGMIVLLAGIALSFAATVIYLDVVWQFLDNGGRIVNGNVIESQIQAIYVIVGLTCLANLGGKITCGIPATSRAGYGALWTAVAVECVPYLLIGAIVFGRARSLAPVLQVAWPASFLAPFFFLYFLTRIMEVNRNSSVAALAKATNLIYGVLSTLIVIGIVAAFSKRPLSKPVTLAFGLVAIVYTVCYITLLVRVLLARSNSRNSQ